MPDAIAADALVRLIVVWTSHLLNLVIRQLLRPASSSMLIGSVVDQYGSKADLIAKNALLRHQLALLKRQSKRPKLKPADR